VVFEFHIHLRTLKLKELESQTSKVILISVHSLDNRIKRFKGDRNLRGIVLTILQLQLHLRVQVHSAAVYNIIKMSCHKIRTATASCSSAKVTPKDGKQWSKLSLSNCQTLLRVVYVVKPRS